MSLRRWNNQQTTDRWIYRTATDGCWYVHLHTLSVPDLCSYQLLPYMYSMRPKKLSIPSCLTAVGIVWSTPLRDRLPTVGIRRWHWWSFFTRRSACVATAPHVRLVSAWKERCESSSSGVEVTGRTVYSGYTKQRIVIKWKERHPRALRATCASGLISPGSLASRSAPAICLTTTNG